MALLPALKNCPGTRKVFLAVFQLSSFPSFRTVYHPMGVALVEDRAALQ